jgi:hypothetical protein
MLETPEAMTTPEDQEAGADVDAEPFEVESDPAVTADLDDTGEPPTTDAPPA